MRVGQRLFFAVVPAVLGVFTVAALAYWGRYARQAPQVLVIVATAAALASLAIAWWNTRYVALRIERLGGIAEKRRRSDLPRHVRADELDTIETVVDQLNSAVVKAEEDRIARERAAEQRLREEAELLAETTRSMASSLDEIRLPLHILLENRFGDLNENQEEMLESARTAAERADTELRRLTEISELDRGIATLRKDRVRLGDVIQSLRPTLEAEGAHAHVQVVMDIAPALPPLSGDRARLQEAFALLLGGIVRGAHEGMTVQIVVEREGGALVLKVTNGGPPAAGIPGALARRVIEAHGGEVDVADGVTTVKLSPPRDTALTQQASP